VSRPAILAQVVMAAKTTKAVVKVNPNVVRIRQWLAARKTRVSGGL
jgi:hypothetical protein